ASTFNRGIPYIQIPTSLVSQVDSSIGGKTAIDVPYGKNLIGTFYQPKMVIIDPLVLKTLPEKEYFSGMAEVIKHAIIRDKELFNYLNQEKKAIINRDLDVLEKIIEINCNIKRQIVEEDEKESNLRKILNYGHTIGHAVEKIMDYQLLHGECVAMGMAVEAEISSRMGYLNSNEVKEIEELIKTFNLPITIPKGIAEITIYQTTLLDKKSIKNEPHYSLPKKLGEMVSLQNSYGITVERSTVIETIRTNQLKQS
ncbi:MAG: 3-dehydroquinate synthase, partial [Spirochaetota bacterium]|nr:3-dehydroquinate synthase [Spirochaetota bacterium]